MDNQEVVWEIQTLKLPIQQFDHAKNQAPIANCNSAVRDKANQQSPTIWQTKKLVPNVHGIRMERQFAWIAKYKTNQSALLKLWQIQEDVFNLEACELPSIFIVL